MRVLCAIGQRDGAQVVSAALALVGDGIELIIAHVIDDRPRHDVERFSGPLRRMSPDRQRALDLAEEAAGRAALAEAESVAREAGPRISSAETRLERGKPEQVIVALAQTLHIDLVALRPREHPDGHPQRGPASVGHTARFILDHAPCSVLLTRPVVL